MAQSEVAATDIRASQHRCLLVLGSLGLGGAERQALLTARILMAAGIRVTVFVANGPYTLVDGGGFADIDFDLPSHSGRLPAQLARLSRVAATLQPEVILTFLGSAGMRVLVGRWFSSALRRSRFIASERGHYHVRDLFFRPVSGLLRRLYLRAADKVVVNAATLAANLFAFDGALASKVEVVPNVLSPILLDLDAARLQLLELAGAGASGPIFLAVGSFQSDRNHTLLVEAWSKVVVHHPSARLVVAGRRAGPECASSYERFEHLVATQGVSNSVVAVGEVHGAAALMAAADVVVFPSMLEGSSNALGEAILAGAAIAAVPVADSEVLLGCAGVLATGWTPGALSIAMLAALAGRDDLRRRSAARAATLLADRSAEVVGRRWAEVLGFRRPLSGDRSGTAAPQPEEAVSTRAQ